LPLLTFLFHDWIQRKVERGLHEIELEVENIV